MIKPAVGRVVWFWDDHSAALEHASQLAADPEMIPSVQPMAAIIARVWSDTCVNLAVFDQNGMATSRTSVELWHGEEDKPRPNWMHCEWMPYQKQQAERQLSQTAADDL